MATVNYSFNLPSVGGDDDVWGDLLNANWSQLDSILDTLALKSVTLDAGDGLNGGGDLGANRTFAVDGTVIRTTGAQTKSGRLTLNSGSYEEHLHLVRGELAFQLAPSTASGGELRIQGGDVNIFEGELRVQGTPVVDSDRTIGAGSGLTGGGTLAANRTITLGTPSSITSNSGNTVTGSSHTHSLSAATVRVLMSDTSPGQVGSYIFARRSVSAPQNDAGFTTSGSNLRESDTSDRTGGTLSGTWQLMGSYSGTRASLWLRIS